MQVEQLNDVSYQDLEAATRDASQGTRQKIAKAAVTAAPDDEKAGIAKSVVQSLSPEQQLELRKSTFPEKSGDRMLVFVVGFIVAGVVAIVLALIAWGAAGKDSSVASSILVLGTGFTGAILGGLLGAYTGGGQ